MTGPTAVKHNAAHVITEVVGRVAHYSSDATKETSLKRAEIWAEGAERVAISDHLFPSSQALAAALLRTASYEYRAYRRGLIPSLGTSGAEREGIRILIGHVDAAVDVLEDIAFQGEKGRISAEDMSGLIWQARDAFIFGLVNPSIPGGALTPSIYTSAFLAPKRIVEHVREELEQAAVSAQRDQRST